MVEIFTPAQLADRMIATTKFPTSDGKTVLPLNLAQVKALLVRAITEDRASLPTPEFFHAIADKVLVDATPVLAPGVKHIILAALTYAQAAGARFTEGGPSEDDYNEACRAGFEVFAATLKDKGLLS